MWVTENKMQMKKLNAFMMIQSSWGYVYKLKDD